MLHWLRKLAVLSLAVALCPWLTSCLACSRDCPMRSSSAASDSNQPAEAHCHEQAHSAPASLHPAQLPEIACARESCAPQVTALAANPQPISTVSAALQLA